MPSPLHRRAALRRIGAGLTVALSGCAGAADRSREPRLALTARMLEQPSPDHPPSVRVSLANAGEETIRVGYGQSLMHDGGSRMPDPLVVVPAGSGPRDRPGEFREGCWRYTAGAITALAVARSATLAPGERLTDTLAVYADVADADGDACYPPGEYWFRNSVDVSRADGSDRRRIALAVTITIDESGEFAVATNEPAMAPIGR